MTYINRDFRMRSSYGMSGWANARQTRVRARRRRLVGMASVGALLVTVAIACAAQGIVQLRGADGSVAAEGRAYDEVVVGPGDTLWAIAIEYGDSSRDPRAVVDELRRINGLHSAVLQVGDVLHVPAVERRSDVR